ncbi:hypothetical protein HNP29_001154 [Pseudomonas alcaligenes]|nr:hypothetical protein [Pseudomonas alcaligenes]
MATRIHRSISQPIRAKQPQNETWNGNDRGLIRCWESGRTLATQNPQLAEQCRAGQLPPLHWKGGVARKLKKKEKFGALQYLAQWQGLRGEGLSVVLEEEVTLTCQETGMVVTFTSDVAKLAIQQNDPEAETE